MISKVQESAEESRRFRAARLALLGLGTLDSLAFLAVIAPTSAIAKLHELCGLGEWPSAPIAGYLARSGSLLYGLHGLIILFIAFDPVRYLPLIRFMAWAAILHGLAMFAIDYAVGMPLWWRIFEGPGFTATGVIVLCSLPRSSTSGLNGSVP